MKLKDLFEYSIKILKKASIENPHIETIILIEKILKIQKHKIFTQPNLEIKNYQEFLNALEERVSRKPIAYIINKKEFFGLEFYVEEGVLIPRPETEILVEKVLENLKKNKDPIGLEIGVGSGCISISLLHNKENLKMLSVDISEKALQITKINALKFNILKRLTLKRFDIIKDNLENLNLQKFDFIVSNPPYIPEKDYNNLQEEVKKEPKEALIAGKVGTEFYEKIVERFKFLLKENGFFAFEIGINQSEEVKRILEKNGFKKIEVYKDLASIDRVIIASKI